LDLPLEFRQPADKWRAGAIPDSTATRARIDGELSKEEVLELLETSDWNKAEIARRLSFIRTAVWKYPKKWEVSLQNPFSKHAKPAYCQS
jgi:transcriptional regulator of acetoin/glycerol metabolism